MPNQSRPDASVMARSPANQDLPGLGTGDDVHRLTRSQQTKDHWLTQVGIIHSSSSNVGGLGTRLGVTAAPRTQRCSACRSRLRISASDHGLGNGRWRS